MKINELPGGVIYIENAFPLHKEFIEAIESTSNDIIPTWVEWIDGYPKSRNQGFIKNIDWDYTINDSNMTWPRIDVGFNYSEEHSQTYDILKMIDEPYQKALEVWSQKTGNLKVDLVTKNYTIKKYNTSQMIPKHSDRDHNKDFNTFDWTALIYLNDDYTGGKLEFNNLGYSITPTAGSIVFFSSDEVHTAHEVLSGNKYFIFLYIHSHVGYTHAIGEKFYETVQNILKTS